MKLYKLSLALFLGLGAMATTWCEDVMLPILTRQNHRNLRFQCHDLEDCIIQHTTIFVWKVLRHVSVMPSM